MNSGTHFTREVSIDSFPDVNTVGAAPAFAGAAQDAMHTEPNKNWQQNLPYLEGGREYDQAIAMICCGERARRLLTGIRAKCATRARTCAKMSRAGDERMTRLLSS